MTDFKVGDRVLVTIFDGVAECPGTITAYPTDLPRWPYALTTDGGMETFAAAYELKRLVEPLDVRLRSLIREYEETAILAGAGIRGGVYRIVAERLRRLAEEAS